MSKVRSRDTKPELEVRRLLSALGYRFRLHRKDFPGRPDLILPKYRTAVFINGCFWHQHAGCKKSKLPKQNAVFWKDKLRRNKQRDRRNMAALNKLGWDVLVVWECIVKVDSRTTIEEIDRFLKAKTELSS